MAGKLSTLKVKSLTQPGRFGDGGGLWLQVRDAERRSWLFRYTIDGRSRQMGLGPLSDVSLAEAREAATAARKLVRQGFDPVEQRRAERQARRDKSNAITFGQVVERYLAAHEAAWRNQKHKYQWRQSLGVASAAFGGKPVAEIATGDVMRVLEPIWTSTPEAASRLRGRMEAVLDYAAARGWRPAENPARWRGHLAKLLPSTASIARVQHYAALPWRDIGRFMVELRADPGTAARALEFAILTAARTGETLGARWPEIDLEARIWTVPGDRMKAGREHRVPLSTAATRVLAAVRPARNPGSGDWIFPGTRPGKPLSNMAMSMLLRRMGRGDLTVHGFRSTFRDWCSEETDTAHEVAEAALAHTISSAVERAYRRGDLFEKRRVLMDQWAEFCGSAPPPAPRPETQESTVSP